MKRIEKKRKGRRMRNSSGALLSWVPIALSSKQSKIPEKFVIKYKRIIDIPSWDEYNITIES